LAVLPALDDTASEDDVFAINKQMGSDHDTSLTPRTL
jgi:hypothetical protein